MMVKTPEHYKRFAEADGSVENEISELFNYRLFSGELKIKQLPWKPKVGEKYYLPATYGGEGDFGGVHWRNDKIDIAHLQAKLVCKTKEEATAKAKHMLDSLETFKWEVRE